SSRPNGATSSSPATTRSPGPPSSPPSPGDPGRLGPATGLRSERARLSVDMTTTDELRSKLGRVGIWMSPPAAVGLTPETAAEAIERAGFTSVWVGGGNAGPD